MKITIEVDESQFQQYDEFMNERIELMETMHERLSKYKGNPKKAEKDVIYKESSYNFVIKGIEANDIKDKMFKQIYEAWKESKNESKQ